MCAGKGNNLHEVETEDDEKFLVSMPTKFRKNVWIKRGTFLYPPQTLFVGGILFSRCPCVRPSVRASVRNALFP